MIEEIYLKILTAMYALDDELRPLSKRIEMARSILCDLVNECEGIKDDLD